MIEASESISERRRRGERMLEALTYGMAKPRDVVLLWRAIADSEADPTRRAEALINLATALDYTGPDGRGQAIAITDQALKTLGPKHPEAASAFLMAAQRLVSDLETSSPGDLRKALDYLHSALAVPMTARGRVVLISLLVRYALVAPRVGDFTKLDRAQHLYDRLRRYGIEHDEVFDLLGSMVSLYRARWKASAHRPSLHKAISLSEEALRLSEDSPPLAPHERSDLQQQRAVLLLERYAYGGLKTDLEAAVVLLRAAAVTSRSRAAILNSLSVALMGSDSRPATDAEFEDSHIALLEGLGSAEDPETTAYLKWTEANWNLAAYWRGRPVRHLDLAVEAAKFAAEQSVLLGHGPLFTLASTLYNRFMAGRRTEDIDGAVATVERALALTSHDESDRWSHEVTAANIYQERALNNDVAYDPVDAARAVALQRSALSRLPRDSSQSRDIAATALGTLHEQYRKTQDGQVLEAARQLARALPATPRDAGRLPAVAAINLAVFHLHLAEGPVDREGWIGLLRTVAIEQAGSEAGWHAASNLLHLHVHEDWEAVLEAFQILVRGRTARLSSAHSVRERAMVLRREQSVAAIAGLALVHLGRPAQAAQLVDATQAALLTGDAGEARVADLAIWSSFDALFYPVSTRYGAYAVVITRNGATASTLADLALELPNKPGPPDDVALAAAASLVEAAFGASIPERLLIIPAGALGILPWAAIPVGSSLMIDSALVSLLPTRRLWQARQPRFKNLLLIEAAHASQGSPLRHARAETLQLRAWLPAGSDLRDQAATPEAAKEALPLSDVAHFACHGLTDPAQPMQSHLLLEGGTLSVEEVLNLDCRPVSLVSLSACQSALHGVGFQDEFGSLAVAFLVSGAQFAVGTLWNIHDAAASLFSRRFFDLLCEGVSPREAVRCAQLWMRDSSDEQKALWLAGLGEAQTVAEEDLRTKLSAGGNRRSFADPKYWAGFAIYG